MRGRSKFKKILLKPDQQYNSLLVSELINKVMKGGKKSIATREVYQAIKEAGEKANKQPLEVLEIAIKNASPLLEVRSKRIGGANYQVPMEVSQDRQRALALRWIIYAARGQKGKKFSRKLAEEIYQTYQNTGIAIKKKQDTHKMAEANRAFAHYARF